MPEVSKSQKHLSLADAQKQGRVDDFVRQEEACLSDGADPAEFQLALSAVIKPPPPAGWALKGLLPIILEADKSPEK